MVPSKLTEKNLDHGKLCIDNLLESRYIHDNTFGRTTMIKLVCLMAYMAFAATESIANPAVFQSDTLVTSAGKLQITFIGHGSLMMKIGGKVIYIDPYSRLADFKQMPKADLVLITHQHADHFDLNALADIRTERTIVLLTKVCAEKFEGGTVMRNGDIDTVIGIQVEAVPAYNLEHKRPDGSPFHPKGEGNGYVLTIGKTRVYVAGDTENTPEMKALKNIDVAFLPMNLPYTMTPEMVADAAKAFSPRILYPYHFGDTDTGILSGLLKGVTSTEVRIRNMK